MTTDSKEQILKDWNSQELEIEMPWRGLNFTNFDELYRFLKEHARERGNQSRRSREDELSNVNIAVPVLDLARGKVVEDRKKHNEKLATAIITFLSRIKLLKSGIDK